MNPRNPFAVLALTVLVMTALVAACNKKEPVVPTAPIGPTPVVPTTTPTPTMSPTATLSPTITDTPCGWPSETCTLTPNPACTTTPGTFGNTGSTGEGEGLNQVMLYASQYTLSEAGAVQQLSFYANTTFGNGYFRVAVYADSGGAPAGLIVGSTGSVYVGSTGWFDLDVPITDLTAGLYWLAVMTRPVTIGGTDSPMIGHASSGTGYKHQIGTVWGDFPASFGGSPIDRDYAIHADYCAP